MYDTNPFGVLSLRVGSTEEDIRLRTQELLISARVMGQSTTAIREAVTLLSDGQTRLLNEVLWTWDESSCANKLLVSQNGLGLRSCLSRTTENPHDRAVVLHASAIADSGAGHPLDPSLWCDVLGRWTEVLPEIAPYVARRTRDIGDVRLTETVRREIRSKVITQILASLETAVSKASELGSSDRVMLAQMCLRLSPLHANSCRKVVLAILNPVAQEIEEWSTKTLRAIEDAGNSPYLIGHQLLNRALKSLDSLKYPITQIHSIEDGNFFVSTLDRSSLAMYRLAQIATDSFEHHSIALRLCEHVFELGGTATVSLARLLARNILEKAPNILLVAPNPRDGNAREVTVAIDGSGDFSSVIEAAKHVGR